MSGFSSRSSQYTHQHFGLGGASIFLALILLLLSLMDHGFCGWSAKWNFRNKVWIKFWSTVDIIKSTAFINSAANSNSKRVQISYGKWFSLLLINFGRWRATARRSEIIIFFFFVDWSRFAAARLIAVMNSSASSCWSSSCLCLILI